MCLLINGHENKRPCLRDMSIKHKAYKTPMSVLVKSLYIIDCSIEPVALQTTRNSRNLPGKILFKENMLFNNYW